MEHALKSYRERHAISLDALAKRAQVPKSVLSRIECRVIAQPRLATIRRIIDASDGALSAEDFAPQLPETEAS